jgi:hypothetical protein
VEKQAACGWKTFFTWSGRARALPTSESLLSLIFIISVPVEMSEKCVRTSTPPGRVAGTYAICAPR